MNSRQARRNSFAKMYETTQGAQGGPQQGGFQGGPQGGFGGQGGYGGPQGGFGGQGGYGGPQGGGNDDVVDADYKEV